MLFSPINVIYLCHATPRYSPRHATSPPRYSPAMLPTCAAFKFALRLCMYMQSTINHQLTESNPTRHGKTPSDPWLSAIFTSARQSSVVMLVVVCHSSYRIPSSRQSSRVMILGENRKRNLYISSSLLCPCCLAHNRQTVTYSGACN